MTDILRSWLLALTAAALLGAVCKSVTPKGKVRAVVLLACSAASAAALLSPLKRLDSEMILGEIAGQYARQTAESERLEQTNDALRRSIIESMTEAYISERGKALGLELTVDVQARWDGSYWLPWQAELTASGPEQAKSDLARLLETELGIPRERQSWNDA